MVQGGNNLKMQVSLTHKFKDCRGDSKREIQKIQFKSRFSKIHGYVGIDKDLN